MHYECAVAVDSRDGYQAHNCECANTVCIKTHFPSTLVSVVLSLTTPS